MPRALIGRLFCDQRKLVALLAIVAALSGGAFGFTRWRASTSARAATVAVRLPERGAPAPTASAVAHEKAAPEHHEAATPAPRDAKKAAVVKPGAKTATRPAAQAAAGRGTAAAASPATETAAKPAAETPVKPAAETAPKPGAEAAAKSNAGGAHATPAAQPQPVDVAVHLPPCELFSDEDAEAEFGRFPRRETNEIVGDDAICGYETDGVRLEVHKVPADPRPTKPPGRRGGHHPAGPITTPHARAVACAGEGDACIRYRDVRYAVSYLEWSDDGRTRHATRKAGAIAKTLAQRLVETDAPEPTPAPESSGAEAKADAKGEQSGEKGADGKPADGKPAEVAASAAKPGAATSGEAKPGEKAPTGAMSRTASTGDAKARDAKPGERGAKRSNAADPPASGGGGFAPKALVGRLPAPVQSVCAMILSHLPGSALKPAAEAPKAGSEPKTPS